MKAPTANCTSNFPFFVIPRRRWCVSLIQSSVAPSAPSAPMQITPRWRVGLNRSPQRRRAAITAAMIIRPPMVGTFRFRCWRAFSPAWSGCDVSSNTPPRRSVRIIQPPTTTLTANAVNAASAARTVAY